jgi:2-methylcitrate dehydratase PrpD
MTHQIEGGGSEMGGNDEKVRPTRRQMMAIAGGAVAAAAYPIRSAVADPAVPRQEAIKPTYPEPISDVTQRLTTYMSEARSRELPDKALEQTKWHVLDTLAAIVSGTELPGGRSAVAFARAYGGKEIATVIGDTVACGPLEAALSNGVCAHADETDDSWPGGWHPGCSIIPAALATGEQFGISGAHYLRAVALGYDVGARLLLAVREGLSRTHKATHSVAGIFGAAAAAGCAASLNAQQMRWLLDYTAQQCSGIASWYRDIDHIEKGFVYGGMPARDGVTSALLVHAGWNGVDDVFSGRDNFLIANDPQFNAELLVDKLGERFEIVITGLKKWTVGSPIQAPLDAMQKLVKQHPIEPNQVERILLRSAPGSVVDNSQPPDINIQYAMALMIIDKSATFRAIHDKPRMQDPMVLALRSRVVLEAPAGRGTSPRLPLLEVSLKDGTKLTQDTGPVLGTAENPMTSEQIVAKCRALMSPVIGSSKTDKLIERVMNLEKTRDVRELRPLLQWTRGAGPPVLADYPAA